MTRFLITTIFSLVIFVSIGSTLTGWTRIWLLAGVWTVYLTIVGLGVGFIQLRFFCPVILKAEPGRMRIALTFDDGPDPVATPALLDLLKREKIPATFFCIGKKVVAHPDLAARISADGHLLGNHAFHHAWWTPLLTSRRLRDELQLAQDAIRSATGITPIYMRPPVGHTNPHYKSVLKLLGVKMIGWDVRSMDTRWSIEKVIARVLNQTKDGSIILLHDGNSTADRIERTLTPLIRDLRSRGFEFERLDRLLVNGRKTQKDFVSPETPFSSP